MLIEKKEVLRAKARLWTVAANIFGVEPAQVKDPNFQFWWVLLHPEVPESYGRRVEVFQQLRARLEGHLADEASLLDLFTCKECEQLRRELERLTR